MATTNKVAFAYRRDIPWDFELNSNGDLKMKEDIDAVKQSIYTILMSNFNDKNFEPTFGSDMESMIFEHAYPAGLFENIIEDKIRNSIRDFEPDVTIQSINIDTSQVDNYIVKVTISFLLSDGLSQGLFDEELSFADLKR